jgi:hypothetical protein
MGPYERGCGVTSAEQRGPSVCNVSFNREGKDEMTKASIDLQDLRRRLYVKAKAETSWRFWGLYVHICKLETLHAAYVLAQKNDGAPGIDGVTFAAIEGQGVEAFLVQIRDELVRRTMRHVRPRPRARDRGSPGKRSARHLCSRHRLHRQAAWTATTSGGSTLNGLWPFSRMILSRSRRSV